MTWEKKMWRKVEFIPRIEWPCADRQKERKHGCKQMLVWYFKENAFSILLAFKHWCWNVLYHLMLFLITSISTLYLKEKSHLLCYEAAGNLSLCGVTAKQIQNVLVFSIVLTLIKPLKCCIIVGCHALHANIRFLWNTRRFNPDLNDSSANFRAEEPSLFAFICKYPWLCYIQMAFHSYITTNISSCASTFERKPCLSVKYGHFQTAETP